MVYIRIKIANSNVIINFDLKLIAIKLFDFLQPNNFNYFHILYFTHFEKIV